MTVCFIMLIIIVGVICGRRIKKSYEDVKKSEKEWKEFIDEITKTRKELGITGPNKNYYEGLIKKF